MIDFWPQSVIKLISLRSEERIGCLCRSKSCVTFCMHILLHKYQKWLILYLFPRDVDIYSSQIRAANLSGDCHFSQEMARGNLMNGFYKQHQRCVKRRALLSVEMNPHCQGKNATRAIEKVFNTCFYDTAPFAWIP